LTHGTISATLQFYLLAITFAASAIGSPIWAWAADHVGVFNLGIVSVALTAGLVASIQGATTDATTTIVSILIGFISAGFNAVLGPIYASLSHTVLEIGHRMGMGFFLMGIATLISSPIQGALLGPDIKAYTWYKAITWSAITVFIGGCFLIVTRQVLLKRRGIDRKIYGIAVV